MNQLEILTGAVDRVLLKRLSAGLLAALAEALDAGMPVPDLLRCVRRMIEAHTGQPAEESLTWHGVNVWLEQHLLGRDAGRPRTFLGDNMSGVNYQWN